MTGATSYVASHVIKRLLVDGFQVRGTVRSLVNETKNKPLMELLPEAKFKLKLVEADLLDTASWIKLELPRSISSVGFDTDYRKTRMTNSFSQSSSSSQTENSRSQQGILSLKLRPEFIVVTQHLN